MFPRQWIENFVFRRTYSHHPAPSTYGHYSTLRSRGLSMKAHDIMENRFLVYIFTLLRLVIILPYKCVVSFV